MSDNHLYDPVRSGWDQLATAFDEQGISALDNQVRLKRQVEEAKRGIRPADYVPGEAHPAVTPNQALTWAEEDAAGGKS